MVNIKDVARAAGVSPSTVSRVLGGSVPVAAETRERVIKVVKELNYQPNAVAQGLKGGRIKTIGLIIPNVRNLVFPAAVRGIEDTANQHGYTVVLCNADDDVKKEIFYIEALKRRLVDGFIFCTARPSHTHITGLREDGFPVVSLLRHSGSEVDAVILDNANGAYEATKYLISRGLKKIAVLNGWLDLVLYQDRLSGFRRAMAEAGLPVDESLVVSGIGGWEDGYRTMDEILARGIIPEAVFAMSDPKAFGVIRAIKDRGLKIPADISVMGFDDIDFAAMTDPPLTTVAQPFYDMGIVACKRLLKLIEAKKRPAAKVQVFPARLVIRRSVI